MLPMMNLIIAAFLINQIDMTTLTLISLSLMGD